MIEIILSLCLMISVLTNYFLWRSCLASQKDLLDRIMARDFPEYKVLSGQLKPRRISTPEDKEWMIEKMKQDANV